MSQTAKTQTATASAPSGKYGRKISVGSVKATSTPGFYAGAPSPAREKNGVRYENEEAVLGFLGAPTPGYHWELKAWIKPGEEYSQIIFQEVLNYR